MAGLKLHTQDGKRLQLGLPAGQGGEATVYRLVEQPDRLAKIYDRGPRPEYAAKLAWMAAHRPENPTERYQHASLAWPEALVYTDRSKLAGYTMPYIQGAASILDVFNPRRRALTMPEFDSRYLHRAARNLAVVIGTLHKDGYVVGDLNESNLLVTPRALVTIIDTDSFQVEEARDGRSVLHTCPVGKLEYTPPELHGRPLDGLRRLPEHDTFSLAVLIFQLLMDGNHPFRAQWQGKGDPPPLEGRIALGAYPYAPRPRAPVAPPRHAPSTVRLHPELAELMLRCFVDGHHDPSARPSSADWELAISAAETALISCPQKHVYSNHLAACPYCTAEAERLAAAEAAARRRGSARRPPAAARQKTSPRPARTGGTAAPGANPARSTPARGTPRGWGARSQAAAPPKTPPPPRPAAAAGAPRSAGPARRQFNAAGGKLLTWVVQSAAQSLAQRPPAGAPAPSFSETFRRNLRRNNPWVLRPASPAAPAPGTATAGTAASASGSQPQVSSRPAGQPAPAVRPAAPYVPRPQASTLGPAIRRITGKSLVFGGGIGLLAGAGAAAAAVLAAGAMDVTAGVALLLALGGGLGAAARGHLPALRFSEWISLRLGWSRFLQISGALLGMLAGAAISAPVAWMICPSVIAILFGAYLGRIAGWKLWVASANWNWEQIGAGVNSLAAAAAFAAAMYWLGSGPVGTWLAGQTAALAPWLAVETGLPALGTVAVGALYGAAGGAAAGFVTDFAARTLRLAR